MINISNKKIASIAQLHYNACSPEIIKKLNFLSDLCKVILRTKNISKKISLQKDYDLSLEQIATLINPLLRSKKKKFCRKLRVTDMEVSSMVFSRQLNILDTRITISDWNRYNIFFNLVQTNVKTLLIGPPVLLDSTFISSGNYDLQFNNIRIKNILNYVFNYSKLTGDGFNDPMTHENWNSYKLTSKLNVSVCPYCNKNWINTVYFEKGKKVTNPQLDHFFFKAKYPLLRLSFYNLIPSCETCNARIKKEEIFTYNEYLNPFDRGFYPYSSFRAIPKDTKSNQGVGNRFRIKLIHDSSSNNLLEKSKNQKNFDFFKLKNIYEQHGDIISELFLIKQKYGLRYLSSVLKSDKYKDMKIEEIYRMIFSNYYSEDDFKKRPFSKLTRDIVDDLNLI